MKLFAKEIFELAQDKGYKLFFEWVVPFETTTKAYDAADAKGRTLVSQSIIDANQEVVLCELELIKQWLRNRYKLYVEVYMTNVLIPEVTEAFSAIVMEHVINNGSVVVYRYKSKDPTSSYELALAEGVKEILIQM